MKVSCLVLVVAIVSVSTFCEGAGRGGSNSITWGARKYRDTLLSREILTEKSRFLRVVTRDYVFRQKWPRTITQIVITDQIRNGEGGYATLVAGGPMATYAKIHFKSQRNNGFSFIVDIYGQ
ncbi:probable salivary secreted peptide [Drosophila tropicalis]|uniref:probable salivary secreted peptide n=1 Tax=Drosophila tropicalis TaxID=46794 RepID=UPI0035ABFF9A